MKSCGKLLALAAMLLWISPAIAQPPGVMRGPPGPGSSSQEGFRGRRGPPMGSSRAGPGRDPRLPVTPPSGGSRDAGTPPSGAPGSGDRGARFESFFRSLDTNNNGVIEPGEVPEERKRVLSYMAQRAGINIDGPINIEQLRDGMLGRHAQGPQKAAQAPIKPAQGQKKPGNQPQPLVPGFGSDTELARVPGFGERVEASAGGNLAGRSSGRGARSSSPRPARPSYPAKPGPDQEREKRVRDIAKNMMKRYDTDRSGVVEKHEWRQIKGDPKQFDLDHNGKITEDEMFRRLVNYSKNRGGGYHSGSSGDSRSGKSRSGDSDDEDRPRSYRFTTALELLPQNLPPWFAELDESGDGQVSMAEYASQWDDQTANKFVRLDLNNDGLITPRECLDADSAPEPPAATTGAPAGGLSSSKASGGRPSPAKTSRGGPSPSKKTVTPKTKPRASAEKPWWDS